MSAMPITQPKSSAKSDTQAVRTAIPPRDAKKQAQPPKITVGGSKPKMTFQGKAIKCIAQSDAEASRCSSKLPLTKKLFQVCSLQSERPNFKLSKLYTACKTRMRELASGPCLMMRTVRMASSSPPSSLGSKLGPPSKSDKTTKNSQSLIRRGLPRIESSMIFSDSWLANSTEPSAASKSYPGTAVVGSVRQLTTIGSDDGRETLRRTTATSTVEPPSEPFTLTNSEAKVTYP
mmetsp:Transcript_7137/g.20231  ORF Transcript_7137/g.20231 Transcript_7137/m.20231 type:complete len:233 (+) Transcript_7137:992-1690(+)